MENHEYFTKLKSLCSSYSVLFVDDNLHYHNEVIKFLNILFKNTFIANDGVEGLKLYKKEKIDLILTGLNMPNMNGHDMIREIKKISPDIEVLILSSHRDSMTLLSCIHLGISDFISKPADINKMIIIFLKVLSNMKRKSEVCRQIKLKDEKNEEILSFLYENSMSIDIINYYKGLVFRSAAYIKEVNEESIKLKVNHLQLLACKNEKLAVLDSSLIGENISCSLISSNEEEYEILLKKETFFYPKLKNYSDLILETNQDVKAYFKINKKIFCKINKISKKEISFSFDESNCDIKKHDEMELYLFLDNEENDNYQKVHSIVYKITKENNICKIILLLKKDKNIEEYIEKYLSKREVSLLKEFKNEFLV